MANFITPNAVFTPWLIEIGCLANTTSFTLNSCTEPSNPVLYVGEGLYDYFWLGNASNSINVTQSGDKTYPLTSIKFGMMVYTELHELHQF
jgi:hypothetical protein